MAEIICLRARLRACTCERCREAKEVEIIRRRLADLDRFDELLRAFLARSK